MKVLKLLFLPFLVSLLPSCASPGGDTLIGTLTGSAAGLGIGFIADAGPDGRGRAQNVFAGMTFGALLGAGAGFLFEQVTRKETKPPSEEVKAKPPEVHAAPREPGMPVLIPPKVDGHFVDDQVRGNIFIPGHFEYQIKENARWQNDHP